MQISKKSRAALLLASLAAIGSSGALAQTAQSGQTAQTPAPVASEPADPFAFNVGVVTDYRFRGISQTRREPALQGGADFTSPIGLYAGFWASTIKWIRDLDGGSRVELDVYGGYRGKINDNFAYDVGVLRYQYPNSRLAVTPNTTELYGALTFGPATVKYSRGITDETFGVPNSKGTGYLEAAATFDLGNGFALTPHIGRQAYRGSNFGVSNKVASYTDLSLGLVKDFGNGLSASATIVATNADKGFYTSLPTAGSKYLGKDGVVLGLKYGF